MACFAREIAALSSEDKDVSEDDLNDGEAYGGTSREEMAATVRHQTNSVELMNIFC